MSWQAVRAAMRHRCPTGSAKAVLLVIAEHAHEDGTGACPRVATIAECADVNERTVRHVIRVLVDGGVLFEDESAGRRGWAINMGEPVDLRGVSMRKTAPSPTPDHTTKPAPSPAKAAPSPPAPSPGQPAPSSERPAPSPGPSEPPINHQEPPTVLVAVPDPPRLPASKIGTDDDPDFVEFWGTYPRPVAKGAARKAWRAAVKLAAPVEIIAGAVRYRNDPNRSADFTAHPSTWLNAERWNDTPLPVRSAQAKAAPKW